MPSSAPSWTALAAALLDREVAKSLGSDGFSSPASGMTSSSAAGPDLVAKAERAVADADAGFEAMLTGGAADEDADLQPPDPFAVMATAAELRPIEARVLAVAAAIDADRELQRLVAALRADATATRPDVDLIGRMLGPAAVTALTGDGRLARAALVEVSGDDSWSAATISVPRLVTWALLGDGSLDPDLPLGAEMVATDALVIGGPAMVLVAGADRVRRVQAAVGTLGGFEFLLTPLPRGEAEWRAVVRQATVTGAAVLLDCAEPPDAASRRWLERADHLAVALMTREPLPVDAVPHRPFAEIAAPAAGVTPAEWAAVFPEAPAPGRMPTAQQLQHAARIRGAGRDPASVIHRVASGALLRHARRVTPSVTWDDLVLPAEQKEQLRQLADRYRHREIVHGAWDLPLYPSPGVVAMFAGPSGTGKSTAAEVIAGALGLDMFRVDLSALVSKYIGETEKNLEEIFAAATAADYVLLFDEADALFGARSKVSDARDRYANMEVSYLLQRLESYDGFVILTSNFQGNIDPAFLRRIHVAIPFAVPNAADREQIWLRSLAGAPQQDLDIASVAQRFDLTGGSIRMAALSAAYLAASRGTSIGMAELTEAIAAEMTKLRRRATEGQFVPA